MYAKYSPCIHCAKYIIASGITKVVVGKVYRNSQAIDMLKSGGVEVEIYQENPEWHDELLQLFSEDIPERTNEGTITMNVKK